MKIPEHVALSFLLAQLQVQPTYGAAGTALMLAAGCLPDLDGLTLLAGWNIYRRYHRILGHGLPVALLGPAALAAVGNAWLGLGAGCLLWFWLQVSLLLHLLTDICFYRWPVLVLWPVSGRGWGLGLLSWNDLVPTLVLYAATAAALMRPEMAPAAALPGISGLALYLAWRFVRPRPQAGWGGWLAGGWAPQSHRVWRWLTGDFVT